MSDRRFGARFPALDAFREQLLRAARAELRSRRRRRMKAVAVAAVLAAVVIPVALALGRTGGSQGGVLEPRQPPADARQLDCLTARPGAIHLLPRGAGGRSAKANIFVPLRSVGQRPLLKRHAQAMTLRAAIRRDLPLRPWIRALVRKRAPVRVCARTTPGSSGPTTAAAQARSGDAGETDFATEGRPPDWLVDQCRYDNAPQGGPEPGSLHCEAIIAIAEGRLAPGEYSDEQLREALGD